MNTVPSSSNYSDIIASLSKGSGASSLLAKYKGLPLDTKAGIYGMVANVGGEVIDNATTKQGVDALGMSYTTQNVGGAFASNALKGAGMGAALGPVGAGVGAALYGTYGAITANQQNKKAEQQKTFALDRVNEMATDTAQENLTTAKAQGFNSKGGYSSLYKKGGYIKYPNGGKIFNPNKAGADLNFIKWYETNTVEGKRGVPYSDKLDYDYYSFYKNKDTGSIDNHFPDTYKRPNHETFSNESSYSGNGAKGYWEGETFKKYPEGGTIPPKRKPIIVTDPNDKRLRAYNDSNDLYNIGVNLELKTKQWWETGADQKVIDSKKEETLTLDEITKRIANEKKTINSKNNFKGTNSNIKPINGKVIHYDIPSEELVKDKQGNIKKDKSGKPVYNKVLKSINNYLPVYQEPVQPVIYQKPQPQQPVVTAPVQQPVVVQQPITPVIEQQPVADKKYWSRYYGNANANNQHGEDNSGAYMMYSTDGGKTQKRYSVADYEKIMKTKTFAKGGNLTPEYEVEGNEVVQGQDVQLEGQQDLASDMTQAVGPSHENGGVMGAGGERVFSDRLVVSDLLTSVLSAAKIPVGKNQTYANVAAKLGKLKGKYEKKINEPNMLPNRTGKVMAKRMDDFIELVFQDQEFSKEAEVSTDQFAEGGKLPSWNELGDENYVPDNSPVRVANSNKSFERVNRSPDYFKEEFVKNPVKMQNTKPSSKPTTAKPTTITKPNLSKEALKLQEEKKANPAWKNFKGNYQIYDKPTSTLNLYDNKHNLIGSTRAGRGVGRGEAPNTVDIDKPLKGQEHKATTPAGSYVLKEEQHPDHVKTYGHDKIYSFAALKDGTVIAEHGIYNGDYYNRVKVIDDPNIKEARVSYGCLNIPKQFLKRNDMNINTGDSLFITKDMKFAKGGTIRKKYYGGGGLPDIASLRKQNPTFSGSDEELTAMAAKRYGTNTYTRPSIDKNTLKPDLLNETYVEPNDVNDYKDTVNKRNIATKTSNSLPYNTLQVPSILNKVTNPVMTPAQKPKTITASSSTIAPPVLYDPNKKIDIYNPDKPKENTKTNFANDFFTGDQAINTAVALANIRNANKRKTGYTRQVPRPVYMRTNNMLPYMKNNIETATRTAGVAVDRTSGNVQDVFARKATLQANALEAGNNAAVQQQAADNAVYNQNVQIGNNYRATKAAALNADAEDRVINENAIMTNKQNATNAWLQGVMGNLASKRSYDVEKAKIDIARMDGNRGTAGRSDLQLDEMLDKIGYVKKQSKAKGGYIKRKGGYC